MYHIPPQLHIIINHHTLITFLVYSIFYTCTYLYNVTINAAVNSFAENYIVKVT